jgi:hypothetical protein
MKVARGLQIDYIDMINRTPKGELRCEFKRDGAGLASSAAQFFSLQ